MSSKIKLINGDCLEVMDRMIAKGVKVDCIITDPPYILDFHGVASGSKMEQRTTKIKNEIEFISKGFDYEECFDKFLKIQKTPNILIFCSNAQLSKTMKFFEDKKLSTKCLIWNKTNPSPLCNGEHIEDIEFVVFVRGKNVSWNKEAPTSIKYKVKRFPFVSPKQRLHPTQKPLELMEEYVLLHSLENDVILDPFMGSGTTGLACKNLNRRFIGIELDEKYYNIAKERLR